jgi:hypothetical protein
MRKKKLKFRRGRPASYGICLVCSANKGEPVWKEVDDGYYEGQYVVLCKTHFDDLFEVD